MGLLIFLATTMNRAWTEPEYSNSPVRGLASVNKSGLPCDGGLSLKVIVTPIDAVVQSPVGVAIQTRGPGHSTFRRLQSGEARDLSADECQSWQKKYWLLLGRVLAENKDKKRAKLSCINRADIEFKIGSKLTKDTVCLTDSRKDRVTGDFKRFFEGTDRLLVR